MSFRTETAILLQCISFSYYVSQVCFRLDSWYRKWPLTKKSNDSEPSDFLLPAMAKTYTSVEKIKAFPIISSWIKESIENTITESNLACSSWIFLFLITKITSFLIENIFRRIYAWEDYCDKIRRLVRDKNKNKNSNSTEGVYVGIIISDLHKLRICTYVNILALTSIACNFLSLPHIMKLKPFMAKLNYLLFPTGMIFWKSQTVVA